MIDDFNSDSVIVSDSAGKIASSSISTTKLGYLSSVTGDIQTQINNKANTSHTHSSILDSSNSTVTTLAYSKNCLTSSEYNYLAAWNGYELRAIRKTDFMTSSASSDWVYTPTPTQYVFTINGGSYTVFTGWNNCITYVNNSLKLAHVQLVLTLYSPFVGFNLGTYGTMGQGFPKPSHDVWVKFTNNYNERTTVAKIGTDGILRFGWGYANTTGCSSSYWWIAEVLYPIA